MDINNIMTPITQTRFKRRSMRRMVKISTKHENHGLEVEENEEEEDDQSEVEEKLGALKRIVPGGESLEIEKLFDETANYIMELQCQVKAMKLLASFFLGLEKKKKENNMKFGG